jgi:hypothetical protein
MKPNQLHPCSICRSATTSQEQLKALTGKGIALCRGLWPAPPESGCDLRKISWDCIDAFNADVKSTYSSPYRSGNADLSKNYTITAADPQLYLSAWNGPKEEGREWFDVDRLHLRYRSSGGAFSDVMTFDVYALPGMYSITLTIRISISERIEILYPQYEVVLNLRISR